MTRPPFPEVWDASMVSALRSCGHKFFRDYMEHWKPKYESIHLHAGKAFAEGLEATRRGFFERGLAQGHALGEGLEALVKAYGDFTAPEESSKTLDRMLGALEFYFDTWPMETDHAKPAKIGDRLGIEFSFAEPLGITHPDTGNPLIYCGRADQVVEYAGGLFIEDDKTTSQLGASWGRQWDLRSQFTGYCWAGRKIHLPIQGTIVRGVSILKTKYGSAEAITYRPEWQVKRWHEQVLRDISRALLMWQSGYWDYSLDHACEEYGGCQFKQICLVEDPQPFLELNFEQRRWNPLTREEEPLHTNATALTAST